MFRYKNINEQLREERMKNEALEARVEELTEAAIELAEIIAGGDGNG